MTNFAFWLSLGMMVLSAVYYFAASWLLHKVRQLLAETEETLTKNEALNNRIIEALKTAAAQAKARGEA